MKKKVFLLVSLIMLFGFLTASGVEISFWYALSGANGSTFKGLVDRYNNSQSAVKVNAIYSGSYADTAQKITASLAADILPNAGVIPAGPIFTGARGNYKILDYIENDPEFDKNDFYSNLWDYAKFEGKICAIPFNISTPLLYFNKDLLSKSGIDAKNPPEDWAELMEYSKKITLDENKDGEPEFWGMDMVDTPWLFKSFLLQNGCDIINSETLDPLFSTAEGIQTAEFWKKLIDEKAMPVGMHQIAETRFLGGNLGFYLGSSSRLGKWMGNTSFEFGVAFLPGEMRRAIPIGGAVLVLFPKNKDEDDAAWDFIKWVTSPEIVAEFARPLGKVLVTERTTL